MRIKACVFLTPSLLLALTAGAFIAARAGITVVAVSFSGTLANVSPLMTQLHPGVVKGDVIIGTFTYDSSLPGSAGNFSFTGSTLSHTLSFGIYPATGPQNSSTQLFHDLYTGNGSLPAGGYYDVKVSDNSAGQPQVDIMGNSVYKSALTTNPNLTTPSRTSSITRASLPSISRSSMR